MNGAEKQKRMDAARETLLEWCPRGSTVYVVCTQVARSGMSRHIMPVVVVDGEAHNISWLVAPLLGRRHCDDDTVLCEGCGMDMGFDLVYSLSRALYCQDGYDRDGAYALSHRWL